MAFKVSISEPSTLYVNNLNGVTAVEVFLHGLKLPYFFRVLNGKFDEIKFNLCHAGTYDCLQGSIVRIVPIEINPLSVSLPKPDRMRFKSFDISFNPELTGSPARNFTGTGKIETGTKFKDYPYPVRVFILLHEIGHFFYTDEADCDLFAAKMFINMGYNNSTAFYSLSNVLNCDVTRNKDRVMKLFNNLNK